MRWWETGRDVPWWLLGCVVLLSMLVGIYIGYGPALSGNDTICLIMADDRTLHRVACTIPGAIPTRVLAAQEIPATHETREEPCRTPEGGVIEGCEELTLPGTSVDCVRGLSGIGVPCSTPGAIPFEEYERLTRLVAAPEVVWLGKIIVATDDSQEARSTPYTYMRYELGLHPNGTVVWRRSKKP